MLRAALPTRSVAAARSTQSARKGYWSSSHSRPSTRGRAWRPRRACTRPRTCEGSRTRRGTRITASRASRGNGSMRWRIATTDAGSRRGSGGAGDAGGRPGPILTAVVELNRRWQAPRRRLLRASRAATRRAGCCRHASIASRKSSGRVRIRAPAGRVARGRATRLARRIGHVADRACRAPRRGGSMGMPMRQRSTRRPAHRAMEAGAQAHRGRRSAGDRGGAARGNHVDRQREAAGAVAGARSRDSHAGPDAPLRGGVDDRRAAPARTDAGGTS